MLTTSIGAAAQQHVQRVDVLVEHERMIAVLADRQTLFVGAARLLDVDVDVADGFDDAHRIVHQPAGVRVGDQAVARLQLRGDGSNPFDINLRIAADFQLEAAIAFGSITGNLAGHDIGSLLRDRSIQTEVVAVTSAEQHAHRLIRRLAENVPAGHVDGRLHIRMPLQRGIHATIQLA